MNFNSSMYWRKSANKKYLTKKSSSLNRVISLGVKSDETVKIYEDFLKHKEALKNELAILEDKLEKIRKLNKIEFLTRVPSELIEIYQKINELKLDDKMILIGTNALYAYESHCALFIEDEPSLLVTKLIEEYMVNIDINNELNNMKYFNKNVIENYIHEIIGAENK